MRLTKNFWQSKLEFTLRLQQYIELIRTQDEHKVLDAIAHAKKFMLPFKDTYPKEVQRAFGLLAVPPGGRSSVYEVREPLAPSF
jgi:macrophage erythroblast attacher